MQRLLMGNGAKKSLEAKRGKPKKEGDGTVDEWQTQAAGGKVVPEAREDGIATGARVWVSPFLRYVGRLGLGRALTSCVLRCRNGRPRGSAERDWGLDLCRGTRESRV